MQRSATVEIDLDALTHNLSIVRQHAGEASVMAVIKANAYGHGMLAVAKHLEDKVEAFAVACVKEAVVLRESGINSRIVILQGFQNEDQLALCVRYQLEPVCHQNWQIEMLLQSSVSLVAVWQKVDTGMHRLGLSADEIRSSIQTLTASGKTDQLYLMSHFANADQQDNPLTQQQLELFNQLENELGIESTIANSAAIVSIPGAIKHWVRPGIMLYGSSPLADKTAADLNLKPVMTLNSKIIAITSVPAGEAIGYGSTWQAKQDTVIAVVSIGYGDGYPRHAKTGTPVFIHRHRCELVGRVSMDMICVDISSIVDDVKVGDPAILWGDQPGVDEVAKSASTISYEILCHAGKDQ